MLTILSAHFPLFLKSLLIPGPLLVILLWSHWLGTAGLHTALCTFWWSPTQCSGSDLIPMYLVLACPQVQMVLFGYPADPCWRSWLGKPLTSLLNPLAWSLELVMYSCQIRHVATREFRAHRRAATPWLLESGLPWPNTCFSSLVESSPPTVSERQPLSSVWFTTPLPFPTTAYEILSWTMCSYKWP